METSTGISQILPRDTKPVSRLRALRRAQGLQVEVLAARTGLSGFTILSAERGDHEPTRVTKKVIANALEVDVDDIWPQEVD